MDDRIVIPTSQAPVPTASRQRSSGFRWVITVVLLAALWSFLSKGPRLDWTLGEAPQRFLNADSVVATPGAFSLLAGPSGSGGAVWTTSDGVRWLERPLPRIGYRVVYHPIGLFVMDGRSLAVVGPHADDFPVVVGLPGPVRIGNGSGRPGLVSGLGGLLAQTVSGDIYFAPDGRNFTVVVPAHEWSASADITSQPRSILSNPPPRIRSACQPVERRAPDIVPIVATGTQMIAFVPESDPSIAWPVCEPVLWVSGNGIDWNSKSTESPFPEGAYLTDVDWRDGRFVAVGGIGLDVPIAWTSTDGVGWEVIELIGIDAVDRLIQVEQGGLGWVIVSDRSATAGAHGWFSTDGVCFRPVRDGVLGANIAINDDSVISVGRSPEPDIWVATLDGLSVDLGWCRP